MATAQPLPDVAPIDLAWLAGIIDGEGSIALSHGGASRSPHLRVQITNGSVAILEKVGRILTDSGVAFTSFHEVRGTTNVATGTVGALRLHRMIRPYLVRQVEQFDAAVAFMRLRYDDGRHKVLWTDADRGEWESLRRRFHKRGTFK